MGLFALGTVPLSAYEAFEGAVFGHGGLLKELVASARGTEEVLLCPPNELPQPFHAEGLELFGRKDGPQIEGVDGFVTVVLGTKQRSSVGLLFPALLNEVS